MAELPPGPYHVVILPSAKQQLRDSVARAETEAVKAEFLKVVQNIIRLLSSDPISRGDPQREYEHAGLLQMQFLQDQVLTRFGVDELRKIVYVRDCKPVLRHPLAPP